MKVIQSEDDLVKFDNGVSIVGEGEVDCCARNYLDFEQLELGAEFPDMTLGELVDAIKLKDDGFIIKDIDGTPKWVQARSYQNGYYSNRTNVLIKQGEKTITLGVLSGEESE